MKKKIVSAAALALTLATPVLVQAGEGRAQIIYTDARHQKAIEEIQKAKNSLLEASNTKIEMLTNTIPKYCNTANVNIRLTPDTDSQVIGTAGVNNRFEVLQEDDGWSLVLVPDNISAQTQAAYIKSEFLQNDRVKNTAYTQEDLYVLAHVICGEAQNCSDAEQRYVASVVVNRVKHPSFPGSIKGVVFQKGQYSCTRDGNYYREPTARNWANAKYVLENGSVFPDNVIWQSGSRQGKGVYLKTNVHYYCY